MEQTHILIETTVNDLRRMGDPKRAVHSQRFFKTGPGQYGEGDEFLGISVPDIRAYEKAHRPWSVEVLTLLLQQPYHEVRLLALIGMTELYKRTRSGAERVAILSAYLGHTAMVNNWDLVDTSAPGIVGEYVHAHPEEGNALLDHLAASSSVFESWLSGAVDLELNVKTYGRDSAGSFLLSESNMKKRETTEGRSKSESFTSIIDSVVQSKLDSISLLESVRQQSDIEASSKVKHDTKRTVDGVSWIPVVIVLLIIICVIYLRGTGALTFKSIKSLWSKKQ